ncbi:uncharacterized protein LOC113751218 isoform X3 [Coffea eugenioides]|uniref:uncharacterized protein LOC113751218 isoform X3 n=1 Tax=Coffea eugenioides TaxID=49369 RepID=UPI000F60D492|nr:uncharacterized protein LOC113751218 isoform X3 [Coffea eugenioides]
MAGTIPIAMEENEKMVALKKAYAEMILNTAKEAAARVMAAQRKAKMFEHDLNRTKEEALRMLLRFKQMLEDKNAEAEVASSNQQRRIQELELQLDEAEGLILDLRAKLDKVHEQLDNAKKASSWDPSTSVHQCPSPFIGTALSSSQFDNGLVDNPVFAYIVLEKKEPESHRNTWTQKIHAIEKGLVDEKMSQVEDSHSLAKSISIIQRNGGNRSLPSITEKSSGIENIMKEAPFLEDNATKVQPVNVQKLRRRRTLCGRRKTNTVKAAPCLEEIGTKHRPVKIQNLCRRKTLYGRTKASRCRYISNPCVKPQRMSSVIARCKSYAISGKDVDKSERTSSKNQNITETENGSELEEKAPLGKYRLVRRSVRKRKVKYWDDFATSCRPVRTHPCQFEECCQKDKCGAQSGEYLLEVKHEGELEDAKGKAAFATVSSTKTGGASCFDGDAESETKLIHQPMLVKHAGVAPEMELENENSVPSEKRNAKASELTKNFLSSPDSSNPLLYTFSRKRKNGSLVNHAEGCSLRESSMKRRSREQKDIELVADSSTLENEPTSDSRGLVKVARQLISLSGKMWW